MSIALEGAFYDTEENKGKVATSDLPFSLKENLWVLF